MKLKHLFQPVMIGCLEVKNRIVMSPMGIGAYNDDETVADDYISFIRARAGDTGLIITTGSRVTSKYGTFKLMGCYDDGFIPGMKRLAKAAQEKGSKIFLQILSLGGADPDDPYVPSRDVPMYREEWEGTGRPVELSREQIGEIIQEFIQGARRAKEAGFDGVELFGAEDFLVSTFICPYLNRREDEYGGSFENRMRFPVEIVKGIKDVCGDSFPVGFKFNSYYDLPDGIDLGLGVKIARKMVDAGVSYIHEWSFAKLDRPMSMFKYSPMPSLYQPRNTTVPIAQNLKNGIKDVPIIAVGGILKPDEADAIIKEGKTDMVALGRAFIADSKWASSSKQGLSLRPCIRCHVCHHEVAVLGKIVACSVNPDVLEDNVPKKTELPKNVMVVGAGPGGITAALTASIRGHKVTLYEKEAQIGGKLVPGSAPEFKHEFQDLLRYFRGKVKSSNVELVRNVNVTPEFIKEKSPDVLIVATGGVPVVPAIEGIEKPVVVMAENALLNAGDYSGKKIIVIGGGDVGCETALLLSRKGNDVAIVEMLDELMKNEDIKHNTMVLEKLLKDDGVELYLNSTVIEITDVSVKIKDAKIKDRTGKVSELMADIVVLAVGYETPPEGITGGIKELLSVCEESHAIGDCTVSGRIRHAVSEGFRVGSLI
jgi:2,4-dienoyl-CoA reductase-like NADH-dependent reductase (Old Yellow Enzyme family)/NADPH-dependent 2,4-dienoyl-CoA reductase/sulfur reductase-like enzyme